MFEFIRESIEILKEHDLALARRVKDFQPSGTVWVLRAKDGNPVPQVGSVSLHSTYRPLAEAARLVSSFLCREGQTNIIYGLGFGYHLQEMLKRTSGPVTVIEPSMEVFHAFISSVDIRPFLPRTRFLVTEPPAKVCARTENPAGWNILEHAPSIRISQDYFQRLETGRELAGYLQSRSLKILVVNPIYGGSLPTARFCARALENLGHQVRSVECDKFENGFFFLKEVTRDRQNTEVLSHLFMNLMGEITAAQAAEFRPDLILSLAQAPLTPDAIQRLKALKIPIVFWFVEDFRTLTYWKEIANSYDFIFTLQKDPFFTELEALGAKNFYYLPQGCFPGVHKPVELTSEEKENYGADLSFMGAAYYNRQKTFPQLLDFEFKIWGTEWDLESPIGARVQNGNQRVSTEDSVKIYNGGKINLNLHSSTYHENINPDGDFVNPRTFEIAACKGFQLVDARSELGELFKTGEEIITFNSVEDLKQKIAYYLGHQEERQNIAQNGYNRVLAEHTMEHRMREMLIHVFLGEFEQLKRRLDQRKEPIEIFIEQAGAETDLGRYLERFRGVPEFSLKTVMDHIAKGEGALTKTEMLMLMLNQLVKEEV